MGKIHQIGGETIFHDPGPEMIMLFKSIDPSYEVQSVQPGIGFTPKFQLLREKRIKTNRALFDMSEEELIILLNGQTNPKTETGEEYFYSALDILCVLSLKHINKCKLCGWNCGTNRYSKNGKCGLGSKAYHDNPFIHIAEEAQINPPIVTNFGGCALRCIYCIDHQNWDVTNLLPCDSKSFWKNVCGLMNQGIPINTLEFTNPTESLPGVLAILNEAPADFNRPVVLNCHLYGSHSFYNIANHVTDVWLPDLRYGNDKCAKDLSGVDSYMRNAKNGLEAMVNRDSKVIVRILVLPGHVSCCHEPAIRLLSKFQDKIWVSILDQYVPENEAHLYPELCRRPTKDEISEVVALAEKYGLRNIEMADDDFWAFDVYFK